MRTDVPQIKLVDAKTSPLQRCAILASSLSNQNLLGQTLSSRYLVERELKRGGFGIVYLAQDLQLHSRQVVIKVLLDDSYESEYVVQKFRQEIEALSRIDHPGIVGIIDAGELPSGKRFIVMQYVDGVSLRSVMAPGGMGVDRAAGIIRQLGRALTTAHNKGILHRDLKPENIMLQDLGHDEEQVKIIDFGVARVKDSVVAPSTNLNLSPGTVAYMAPEQLSGAPLTAATDVFALGAIAYEMLTGRKPFNPETGYQLLGLQQSGVKVKPTDLRPVISLPAQQAILKSLAFDSADRYQTAREFTEDLARALSGTRAGADLDWVDSAVPPTVMVSEVTPLAAAPRAEAGQTIKTFFQQPPNPGSATPRDSARLSSSRSNFKFGAALLLLVLAAVAFTTWYMSDSKTENPSPAPEERSLSYGLTVQKVRDGKPYQEPFKSSGQEIFEDGWKFRMELTSPQAGTLYLLNEGPGADGTTTYNILFPAPSTNSGSAKLQAGQSIQTGWMVFVDQHGTEKFWMVWATEAIPELEAVKGAVNEIDKGEIKDDHLESAVRDFLAKHASAKPVIEIDKATKQTKARGTGPILVNLIELEHH